MSHKIPENVTNSNLRFCVDEFVRIEENQQILLDRWFKGLSIEQLAGKYIKSETQIKKVVYDLGDKIILRATKM